MANVLTIEKQTLAIHALAEGNSIRSIERITGVHRDTIMRLGIRVGDACTKLMHEQMRNLSSRHIEVDEVWGFVGMKQRNVNAENPSEFVGDCWTFVAIDAESKVVPSFVVGKRDWEHTNKFVTDLASRMRDTIQLSSDGMNQYLATVEDAFGTDVNYGQIVKVYGGIETEGQRRYSPPPVIAITKKAISGEPDLDTVSTSYVERQNLTLRMHCRRLTRLTNAFSKKFENFRSAVGLNYGYYNYCLWHKTIRCTPAMAAGVSKKLWTVRDLVELAN
jgi:IS1 family transposase